MSIRNAGTSANLKLTTDLPSTSIFTITWWGRIAASTGTFGGFLSVGNSGTFYTIGVNPLILTLYDGGFTTGRTLTVGRWYHFAYTKYAATHKIYVNGELDISLPVGGNGATNSEFIILDTSGVDPLDGSVEAVKYWAGVDLSPAEIRREIQFYTPVRWTNFFDAWSLRVTGEYSSLYGRRALTASGTLSSEDHPPGIVWAPPHRRVLKAPAAGSGTVRFRKTLSGIGTHSGGRQIYGW